MFEYLLSSDGKIIARECEAHEGLHLDERVAGTVTTEALPLRTPRQSLIEPYDRKPIPERYNLRV